MHVYQSFYTAFVIIICSALIGGACGVTGLRIRRIKQLNDHRLTKLLFSVAGLGLGIAILSGIYIYYFTEMPFGHRMYCSVCECYRNVTTERIPADDGSGVRLRGHF
jgi:hypothetical protein